MHDAALYDQPQGGYVEIYLAHLFGCLEEGGQRLETEIADGVETRMRADARDGYSSENPCTWCHIYLR